MKGCVRGYGNFEELTSHGVDPKELFDNIEDSTKSDLTQTDSVIKNCDNVIKENTDQQHPIRPHHPYSSSKEMIRRLPRSTYFESNRDSIFDLKFDQISEQMSLHSTSSSFSLASTCNHNSIKENKKVLMVSVYTYITR